MTASKCNRASSTLATRVSEGDCHTRSALAKDLGVTTTALVNWEKGRVPLLRVALALRDRHGIPLEDWFLPVASVGRTP